MPEIIRWHESGKGDSAARLAALLANGAAIGLPTETEYAIAVCARHEEAVSRLAALAPDPLAVVVRDSESAWRWLGDDVPTVGKRLARRCWPGPIDLIFPTPNSGPFCELPGSVRASLSAGGGLTLTCPAHEAIHFIHHELAGPLLLGTIKGAAPLETAAALEAEAGNLLTVLVDDGQTRYGRSTTAVRITSEGWNIVRPGLAPVELVERLACCLILFVCTGNTCRSPLAAALCKKLLAERLGCAPEKLPEQGFLVESAGLSAQRGAPAAAEAVVTAHEFGADLSTHRSQPVTPDLVIQADHVIAMTSGHLRVITDYFVELEAQPRLLCHQGHDVPDPIGGSLPVYQECARLIRDNLEKLLSEIQPS
jgi:protein-tyrosine phosphatase